MYWTVLTMKGSRFPCANGPSQSTGSTRNTSSASPIFHWGRKKVSYLLTYGFNISELKRAQTQLEDALRTKDEFLATVSHEIRTPLHSIIVLAELLNQSERVEKTEEYAGNIHSSSRHLLALVNDILDFSKAEAGRLELDSPQGLRIH